MSNSTSKKEVRSPSRLVLVPQILQKGGFLIKKPSRECCVWIGRWLRTHFLVPCDQPMALLVWSEASPINCLFSNKSTEA